MKEITPKEFILLPKYKQTCCVIHNNGTKFWYKNGRIHRDDGPAVESADGTKFWYKNGKIHREDGPAREYANSYKEYWLNDKEYSYNEWYAIVNKLERFI